MGKFLISPYKLYGEGWSSIDLSENESHFVTVHDLTKKRDDPGRVLPFSTPNEFIQYLSQEQSGEQSDEALVDGGTVEKGTGLVDGILASEPPDTRSKSNFLGRIVFLRGYPSPNG